jgi:hypothetical protein
MRISDLDKRVRVLEQKVFASDELGLVLQCFNRQYHRMQGELCPPSAVDAELNRLAELPALPPGSSSLLTIAWELSRENRVSTNQKGEN